MSEDVWVRDPLTGAVWTEEDELAASDWAAFEASWATEFPANFADLPGIPNAADLPKLADLPDLSNVAELEVDEAWGLVDRVGPRPLPGVSGVTGPALAAGLAGLDVAVLSPAQLVEVMTGAERLARWAQSVQLAAVKAFSDYAEITDEDTRDHPLLDLPGGAGTVEVGFGSQREIERFCADGIGAALGVSYTAGQQLIDTACFASEVAPARQLLAAGVVDVARLTVLARELAPVGYNTAEEQGFVDTQIAEHAALTPRQLRTRLREAVVSRDPASAREAHERALNTRGVWMSRKPAGMAGLHLRLTAAEAQLAYQALNAAAWHQHDAALTDAAASCEPGPYRPFDTFRADAFVTTMRDLQMTYLQAGPTAAEPARTPAAPGPTPAEPVGARSRRAARMMDPARVMLHLYMSAATLVGANDQPGMLLGYGPIGADQARALAEDATIVRLLSDPVTGSVTAIDTPAYRVPRVLRWAVQARDRTCVFPGCDIPAHDTQLDHINPHPFARRLNKAVATGTTRLTNLQQLCLRHHQLKTHGGWSIQNTNTTRLEWISPTGHTYRRNPEWGPPPGFTEDHHPGTRLYETPPPKPPTPEPPEVTGCPF